MRRFLEEAGSIVAVIIIAVVFALMVLSSIYPATCLPGDVDVDEATDDLASGRRSLPLPGLVPVDSGDFRIEHIEVPIA